MSAANRSNCVAFSNCYYYLACLLFLLGVFIIQCSAGSYDLEVASDVAGGGGGGGASDTSQSDAISNDYCNSNIECGFESNSVCYNGTCICKLGYHWTQIYYKCMQKNCTKDDQCTELFPNTVCDTSRQTLMHHSNAHYCVCPTTHIYRKVDQKCIAREEASRPSNLPTYIFIAGGIVILLVLVAGGCSGGRWFYLHYRPPTTSGGIVTASSMTVNDDSPPSTPTPYPPYLSKADHHQFEVVGELRQSNDNNNVRSHHHHHQHLAPPPPYSRSPSVVESNPNQ